MSSAQVILLQALMQVHNATKGTCEKHLLRTQVKPILTLSRQSFM
jgi:hypothetical protein